MTNLTKWNKEYFTMAGYNVLLSCEDEIVHKIARKTNITYSRVFQLINIFEEIGLVTSTRSGRIRRINLTEKGKEVYKDLLKMDKLLVR